MEIAATTVLRAAARSKICILTLILPTSILPKCGGALCKVFFATDKSRAEIGNFEQSYYKIIMLLGNIYLFGLAKNLQLRK
jgi:hypothetical protein